MQYVLSLSDETRKNLVVFTLRELDVKRSAIDFFFDVVSSPADQVAEDGIIPVGQTDDLLALQNIIFGQDTQGAFIYNDIRIVANGTEINPDAPFKAAFVVADRDGTKYMLCDALVCRDAATTGDGEQNMAAEFARIWFLWHLAEGYQIDVTKDQPQFADSLKEAERNGWVEIDVRKASYKLSAAGQKQFEKYRDEAQDLIKRYDIFGDVDMDVAGTLIFDSKLGRDFRIPIYELEGIDPYRARLLIGLNDGDFDDQDLWEDDYTTEQFYGRLLKDVTYAPAFDSYDREILQRILAEGKAQLRMDEQFKR